MTAMAVEKSYRLIPRELSIEYSAWESGLDRFVHPNKGQFIGRDALVRLREQGPKWVFSTLEVHDVTDADARGSEAIHRDGELVGRATNGGYGWRVGKSLALAMLKPDAAAIGTELSINILAAPRRATVIAESPFDPENAALRA
jgi:dimethylglycine dehydrogenase